MSNPKELNDHIKTRAVGARVTLSIWREAHLVEITLDTVNGFVFYKVACDKGEPWGCSFLAGAYLNGDGVQKDLAMAVALFKQACDGRDAYGCGFLGVMYASGSGIAKDESRAVALYQQACDGGEAYYCGNLGMMYASGSGVRKDLAAAATLFKRACDGGQANCVFLGQMYLNGQGVSKDAPRAAAFFKQACDGGNAMGCDALGFMFENGEGVAKDLSRTAALYKQACDGGDADGCDRLGRLYASGQGVLKDAAHAVALFKQACDSGDAVGCANLGVMLANGEGVDRDTSRAAALFKQACDAGYAEACATLSTMNGSRPEAALPPGNATALTAAMARQVLAEMLGKAYGGSIKLPMYSEYLLGQPQEISVTAKAAALTSDGHAIDKPSDPHRWTVDFQGKRFGQVKEFRSLYFVCMQNCEASWWKTASPIYGILGAIEPRNLPYPLWTDRADAERAADAFNRLVYAAQPSVHDAEVRQFHEHAARWRQQGAHTLLPADAAREQILAESAVKEKDFGRALAHYEQALTVYDTWPEGWFNVAALNAELHDYVTAIDDMNRYLELVPNAADAENVRKELVIWEEKTKHPDAGEHP